MPKNKSYSELGQFCYNNHIGFDLFLFDWKRFELPTVGPLVAMSGGHLNFFANYTHFRYNPLY